MISRHKPAAFLEIAVTDINLLRVFEWLESTSVKDSSDNDPRQHISSSFPEYQSLHPIIAEIFFPVLCHLLEHCLVMKK
jgi:hypothetical protein